MSVKCVMVSYALMFSSAVMSVKCVMMSYAREYSSEVSVTGSQILVLGVDPRSSFEVSDTSPQCNGAWCQSRGVGHRVTRSW